MNKLVIVFFWMAVGNCQITVSGDNSSWAYLTVTGPQQDLPVYLDSLQIGRTQLENCEIPTGTHRLMVVSPFSGIWNANNYIKTFTVNGGEKVEFDAVFIPTVVLNTVPYGASIYENGQMLGTSPVRIQPHSPAVRIEKEGYQPQDILLENLKGPAHIIQLTPDANWVSSHQKIQREHQSKIKWRKGLMVGSLALAAVTGFTTIHFRSRGNDAYADYMATAIPSEMNRYFAKSREYDKYAGASFVMFEIGFVLTGYFFLSSRQ